MDKAYISPIISFIFLGFYLLGYKLNSYPNYGNLEVIFYASGLFWFVYVNWVLGLTHIVLASFMKFIFKKPYKAILISGVIVLLLQGLIYFLFKSGIGLSA